MPEDLTEEAVERVGYELLALERINALFACVSPVDGNTAYCLLEVGPGGARELLIDCPPDSFPKRDGWETVGTYAYQSVVNGAFRDQGASSATFKGPEAAIKASVAAVKKLWPEHARLQLVWRCRPELTDKSLYMRLVATPVV